MKNEMKQMKGVGTFCHLFSFFLPFFFSLPPSVVRSFASKGRARRFGDRVCRKTGTVGSEYRKMESRVKVAKVSGLDVLAAYRYDHQSLQFANL